MPRRSADGKTRTARRERQGADGKARTASRGLGSVSVPVVERAWLFEHLAVTVARVDFVDPALAGRPGVRERGVRIEVRRLECASRGSVYASPAVRLAPAVCRIDLLESHPGAADRMHWHPVMREGEPGDRKFEPAIADDPVGWVTRRLQRTDTLLDQAGVSDDALAEDVADIAAHAAGIAAEVESGLAWARTPWPAVSHDERGMALGRG